MAWHDCEVVRALQGRPLLEIRGCVLAVALRLGVRSWHLSLSHDGGMATAMVVAEG